MLHIKQSGFTNKMMKEMIQYIYTLQRRTKYAEATQLLLVSAATKDNLANYIFAKELFLGKLFQKNEAASFAIFSQLAQLNFPEALYNLGYFYEHGIVIEKNKKQAKKYYKQAAKLGTNYTFISDE